MESFVSQIAGGELRYRVYLPPCYAVTGRRYPTVFMLHGLGEGMDDTQWQRMGLTAAADQGYTQGVLPPMIIVMPNGNDADHGSFRGPSPYPDVIVQELIPLVESLYCVWDVPAGRAIGGLSRGGFWAYWIALTYPELFGKVGGHSPYFFPPDSPTEKNPNNIVDTAPGIEHLMMYFDHGPDDYPAVLVGVQEFVARLAQRGITSQYVIYPSGGHTESYWAAHVGDYLTYYGAGWPLDAESLPSCHAASPTTG
jgi:enterochelin esterase-like enzyme